MIGVGGVSCDFLPGVWEETARAKKGERVGGECCGFNG